MNTDIKLMITLAGKQRLPHLEADIFADYELTCFYLTVLCRDLGQYDSLDTKNDCAWAAYRYAGDVLKGRWLEAEAMISSDAQFAYFYAKVVIKGRWPEAEAVIASDAHWILRYTEFVIKGRWPEAEAVIATDSFYWNRYIAILSELTK